MAEGRRFCENCGAQVSETSNFCPSCGAAQSSGPGASAGSSPEEAGTRRIETPDVPVPPPPQAGRRSRTGKGCLGVVVVLVVLIALAAILDRGGGGNGGGGSPSSPSPPSSSPPAPPSASQSGGQSQASKSKDKGSTVGIGQTATVGDASWVVSSAQPTTQITDQFGGALPPKQGNFVVVDFTFTNNGSDAKTLTTNIMKLTDSGGRNSSPDTDTFGYIPNDKNVFLNQVNPGVSKDGEVIFSVAPGGSGYTLELSNTNFLKSGKATVDLGF